MSSRIAVSLCPFLVLAACDGGSSGSSSTAGVGGSGSGGPNAEIVNLGLASWEVHGRDGQRLVVVSEEAQGGRDGNGDGDALDFVVQVLDLTDDSLSNTGLAVAPPSPLLVMPPTITAADSCAVFLANEAQQGADLDGDGDQLDEWTYVHDRRRGTTRRLELEHYDALLGEHLVALEARNGSAGGFRVAVHDLRDASTEHLPYESAFPVAILGESVAFLADERGSDLNGDGDELDSVLLLYDAETRTVLGPGWASISSTAVAAGYLGLQVSEAAQGQDLDGDGRLDDRVALVIDPRTGLQRGPVQPGGTFDPTPDRRWFRILVVESEVGEDLNGDGDERDSVLSVHDPVSSRLLSTGRAVGRGLLSVSSGRWIGIPVSEHDQGETDLDGDGALHSAVLHVLDARTGAVQNTRLALWTMAGVRDRFLVTQLERRADLNGDGDRDDFVLFEWNATAQRARNLAIAADVVANRDGAWIVVFLSEAGQNVDLNGDGDREDRVLGAYDGRGRSPRNLGLALESLHVASPDGNAVFLVSEPGQGQDLNGDGDLSDGVAFAVHLR